MYSPPRCAAPGAVLRPLPRLIAPAAAPAGGWCIGLLVLSVAVADQLARSLVRPLGDLARASDLLAAGHLASRAQVTGPPEVRQVSAGLNRLAERIGALLAHERETVADLSHRLRTPLTALRINAESLHDNTEMEQMLTDVAGLVVSDQGPGFADPDAARRGMSTGGSTGLGLDIARRIAETSGGSLTVGQSATGGGRCLSASGLRQAPLSRIGATAGPGRI